MMKLFNGYSEVEIKTDTERLLLAALKAVLSRHGNKPSLNDAYSEFELPRFAFTDAATHWRGDVQILTDANNGRDVVRLKR